MKLRIDKRGVYARVYICIFGLVARLKTQLYVNLHDESISDSATGGGR